MVDTIGLIGIFILACCGRNINLKFDCRILDVGSWNRYCSCCIVETRAKDRRMNEEISP